jgi:hypothetical protein
LSGGIRPPRTPRLGYIQWGFDNPKNVDIGDLSYFAGRLDFVPDSFTLLEPRILSDYTTAPCKHECGIINQIGHAKQAHKLLSALNPINQTLLRATTWQWGMDSSHCHSSIIKDVAKLDRLGGMDGGSREATLICVATLHRYVLPVDYARMKTETLPDTCA